MRTEGNIIIDHKRNLVYRVKGVRGATIIIERVFPPSNVLATLDFFEYSFDGNTPALISLV